MSEENRNVNPIAEPAEEPVEETGAPEPGPEGNEAPDEVALEDPAALLESITVERDNLAAEVAELQDRLLRRQAEFENFRRRMDQERQDFARYAGMETARDLLPVVDDLERALEAAPECEGAAAEFVKGIEIIYQRFVDALKRAGLEPIDSVGQPFDPNLHHAVERVETDEAEDETVLAEWQKGYNFKGRLLREAMVKVAVKPS